MLFVGGFGGLLRQSITCFRRRQNVVYDHVYPLIPDDAELFPLLLLRSRRGNYAPAVSLKAICLWLSDYHRDADSFSRCHQNEQLRCDAFNNAFVQILILLALLEDKRCRELVEIIPQSLYERRVNRACFG